MSAFDGIVEPVAGAKTLAAGVLLGHCGCSVDSACCAVADAKPREQASSERRL